MTAAPLDAGPDAHPLVAELDRQVERLVERGYPALAGLAADGLRALAGPLREKVAALPAPDGGADRFPLLLVVRSTLVPVSAAMAATRMGERSGVVSMRPAEPDEFAPISEVHVPDAPLYVLTDVDTGAETLGWTPDDALPHVLEQGRTPLTIEEGVALVTQVDDVLRTRNCFQLMASRRGDKRVPGIWVSERRPRLGWCWAGNHHTWLGMASARGRLAA